MKSRVFLVDDHPVLRDGLAQLINQQEDLTSCGKAGDILPALKGIEESMPDIAIIDIGLGQNSGIRLIEDLVYRYPDLLILTLSMHDETIYAERCLKAGARGYIMKQEPSRKVLEALRVILGGDIYVSENLGKNFLRKLFSGTLKENKSPIEFLSNRELEVFKLIGSSMKTNEIAEQLNLSVKTINTYILHIKQKMDLNNIREVIAHAARWVAKDYS